MVSGGKKVLKNPEALDYDFVPPQLPHRDKQIEHLHRMFRTVLDGRRQTVLLVGSVGTGKTAVAKKFADEFQKKAFEMGKRVDPVYINCRRRNTDKSVLLQILRHFQPMFPDRGFSNTEMLDSIGGLIKKHGTHLIVVLDEADVLLKKGTDLIYLLTRFDEETGSTKKSVSLILISQYDVRKYMDPASASTFGRTNTITFDRYTAEELADIVRQRVEMAFIPGTVGEDVISLIADIASEWGDARYAIELLFKAGLLAEDEGTGEVTAEHVRAAKAETHSVVTESKLIDLALHKKLVLIAAARVLRKKTYATTGEIEEIYRVVCEEYGEEARKHTQFWKYLKDLEAEGLLDTKVSYGKDGTTTHVSLHDVPAAALLDVLEKMISQTLRRR